VNYNLRLSTSCPDTKGLIAAIFEGLGREVERRVLVDRATVCE
jgi:hypothetical protein